MDRRTPFILFAVIIAIGIIGVAFYYRTSSSGPVSIPFHRDIPAIGELDSEHTHMTILVFIDGVAVDFSEPEYQSQKLQTHFEDGNGTVIHKHATGVTLPYLFNTLGMAILPNCIRTTTGTEYCTQGERKLSIFVNRTLINDAVQYYELRNGDKILVNYGDDTEFQLQTKLNQVPALDENEF